MIDEPSGLPHKDGIDLPASADSRSGLGGLHELADRIRTVFQSSGDSGLLARGATWSFGITILATVLGFLIQLFLTRTLGPQQFGTYAYAVGWVGVAATVTKLDFDTAAIRFIGLYAARREWSLIRGLLRVTGGLVLSAGLLLGGLGAAFLWSRRATIEPVALTAYLVACVLFPLTAFLPVVTGSLQGFRRVVPAQVPNTLIRPLCLGGTFLVALGLGHEATAALAVICNAIGTAVALVYASAMLRRTLGAGRATPGFETRTRLWLSTAAGLFAVSLGQLILSNQVDVVVVGTLLLPVEAGYYSIANQLSSLTWVGITAVLFIAMPMIAEYHEARSREELQRLVTMVARVNVLVSMPIILCLVLFGRLFLGVFGPEFVEAYPTLLVLLATSTVGAIVGGLAGFVMSMTGLQLQAAWVVGLSSALYTVLVIPLTKTFGPIGTASATTIAAASRAIVLTWYIRRKLGINVLPFGGLPSREPQP